MEHQSNQLSPIERKIMNTFNEIEDTICNLRDLVNSKGRTMSCLSWFPRIRECEKQLSKLFVATYASEVFFRNPEVDINKKPTDLN